MATSDVKTGRSPWLLAFAAVIALALGAVVAGWWSQQKANGPAVAALMGLELPDAGGQPVRLDQYRGKLLIVNFWATWCAPCREEMPAFVDAQNTYGPKGLQFVGIAVDDAVKVKQFASEIGLNYPALIGGYGAMELSKTLGNGVMALPFTVIVGRDGKVARTQLGPLPAEQLAVIVKQLL